MSTEAIPTGRTQALQRSNMLSASKELSGEKGCVSCISGSASSLHSCARCCGSSSSLPFSASPRPVDHTALRHVYIIEVYITPGLMLLIQLFNGMQSSLSMVYDRGDGQHAQWCVRFPAGFCCRRSSLPA
jgi:hypothetical protein